MHTVLRDKPARFRIIIACSQVDKVRLVIPVLPAIPKGVRVGVDRLLVAKGVVVIPGGGVSIVTDALNHVSVGVKGVEYFAPSISCASRLAPC